MVLLSALTEAIAEVEGIPEKTLLVAVRWAREAGFLSTGARGRHAPHATITDAANLLIAANAAPMLIEAPEAISTYRRLASTGGLVAFDDPELAFLREPMTFGEALDEIISGFVDQTLEAALFQCALAALPRDLIAAIKANHKAEQARAEAFAKHAMLAMRGGETDIAITFRRPRPSASIEIISAGELVARVNFDLTGGDLMRAYLDRLTKAEWTGDRREAISVGYRTLNRIGAELRGAPVAEPKTTPAPQKRRAPARSPKKTSRKRK
jgi:hypothetical protein